MTDLCDLNRVHFGDLTLTIAQLRDETAAGLGSQDLAAERCVFVVDSMRQALGCVAYGMAHDLDFGVVERVRLSPEVEARFAENGVQLRNAHDGQAYGAAPEAAQVQAGRVTVLTSGTTGLLKLIPHTAVTLNTFDRVQSLPENTWFLPYQIGSYAWYQMVALGLFKDGQSLIPGDFSDLAASFQDALTRGTVTAISSTPTFWRHALMSIDEAVLASAPLRSLSMGGEIVDQPILDRLAVLYPDARIRHIYASSEAGAAIVVSDGKAGFNADLLERNDATISVKVEDGRLYIRSPYANRTDADDWVDTQDLVELRGERYYFLGRAGNTMINVGGQKAFPQDIEAHLMAHADVIWARVVARKAPLMGALPVASVVLRTPMDEMAAELMLTTHCEAGLAEFAIPRMWDFLDSIPIKASLKS
jgi:acyl-CoA synthetase (AMP-forming)/AMP-acid ligase II